MKELLSFGLGKGKEEKVALAAKEAEDGCGRTGSAWKLRRYMREVVSGGGGDPEEDGELVG